MKPDRVATEVRELWEPSDGPERFLNVGDYRVKLRKVEGYEPEHDEIEHADDEEWEVEEFEGPFLTADFMDCITLEEHQERAEVLIANAVLRAEAMGRLLEAHQEAEARTAPDVG